MRSGPVVTRTRVCIDVPGGDIGAIRKPEPRQLNAGDHCGASRDAPPPTAWGLPSSSFPLELNWAKSSVDPDGRPRTNIGSVNTRVAVFTLTLTALSRGNSRLLVVLCVGA